MNKKLLLKVKERILNETVPVVMDTWFSVRAKDAKNWKNTPSPIRIYLNWCSIEGYNGMTKIPSKDGVAEHGCKTAGCIAGHAIMEKFGGKTLRSLSKKYPEMVYKDSEDKYYTIDFAGLGAEALELKSGYGRLFNLHNWPEKFWDLYHLYIKEGKYKKANRVVANRIDHYIETGR